MPTHTPRRVTAETAKAAALIVLGVFCALGGFSTSIASAALPVRTMYNAALAREQTVRTALEAPDATPAVLDEVHAVVTAYESVVRRYPASGYSDNALWQAGRLALDAFARFGQPGDKDTGVRLLRRLAAMFPTSTLASRVPEQLARLAAAAPSDSNNAIEPKAPPLRTDSAPSRMNAGAQGGSTALRDRLATIREIRRTVLPDGVRITIELDGEVPFHDERIADPERVFVDLPGTRAAAPLVDKTLRFDGDADVVRQVRVGRHPNNTTRRRHA